MAIFATVPEGSTGGVNGHVAEKVVAEHRRNGNGTGR
jgi:hypothetical protein